MAIGSGSITIPQIINEYNKFIKFRLTSSTFVETIDFRRYFNVVVYRSDMDIEGFLSWKIFPLPWLGTGLNGRAQITDWSTFRYFDVESITSISGFYGGTSGYTIRVWTFFGDWNPDIANNHTLVFNIPNDSLLRCYSGYYFPTGIGSIPSVGPISMNSFRNTARYRTVYQGFIPDYREVTGLLQTNNWNILPTVFPETASSPIPVDNNWHTRLSNVSLTFYTGPISSGYYIDFSQTSGQFACSYSYFSDGYDTWYRYFRVANYGYAIRNVTNGGSWTYFRGSGEVIGTTYQYLYTGTGIYNLNPNSEYRIRYVLDFKGDNANGDSAADYVGSNRFYGTLGTYFNAYATNY